LKLLEKIFLISILLFYLSCSSNQTEKLNFGNDKAYGNIQVVLLDTTEISLIFKLVLSDTIHARMSGFNPGQAHLQGLGQPSPTWFIFLPYSDSLRLYVNNIRGGEQVYKAPANFLNRGYYKISVYPELHIPIGGVYIIKATFCDSTFVRRFMVMK